MHPGANTRTEAEPQDQIALAQWELYCRAPALGAEAGQPRSRNVLPASQLFEKMLGGRLAELDGEFQAYVQGL